MKIKVLTNDGVHIHTLKVYASDDEYEAYGSPVDAEYEGSVNHVWVRVDHLFLVQYFSCYDEDERDYGDRIVLKCPANVWIHDPNIDITIQELRWCFPDLEVIDALYILDD